MRYLKLYLYFLRFSFSRVLEFRIDFTFRIFMDIIFYGVNILFFKVIFLHTTTLGGMSEPQAMIFVMSYLTINSIMMTFLGNNLWWFPIYINNGELDYYLIRPVSSKFFLSLREVAFNSMLTVLISCSMLIYSFVIYPEHIPMLNIILYVVFMFSGLYLYYLLRMIMMLPVFWIGSGRGFDEIFFSLQVMMQRPDQIFHGWVKNILISILPLCLISSYPTRILFEGPKPELIWPLIVVTIVFIFIYHFTWKLALKNYTSASS